jgi:RND family efflux transporter MFP subunit
MKKRRAALAVLVVLAVPACRRQAQGIGGPPPMPVEVVTLTERAVPQTTEYVGTVKSRRSTSVQPQVEGFITAIMVRSGDSVRPGTPLMQIDPGMQEAAVASLDSQLVSRQADLQQARQQAARVKTLFEAGASSQAELEQAQTGLATAEAQVKATEALLREQRVALGYHTVKATTAGVVGDIPVRVGDSVTRSTRLTTIDQNAGLELYINIPVQEAARLRVGLPVQIVDSEGKVIATESVAFVSPAVDAATQSVLAKATLASGSSFRTEQFVRARVVWTEEPAIVVPVVALNRVGGQYFAYLAESSEGGRTVARQRGVELGPIVGNDYVVKSGLKPGEKLIVSGVQKIGDGSPVAVQAAGAAAQPEAKAPGAKG